MPPCRPGILWTSWEELKKQRLLSPAARSATPKSYKPQTNSTWQCCSRGSVISRTRRASQFAIIHSMRTNRMVRVFDVQNLDSDYENSLTHQSQRKAIPEISNRTVERRLSSMEQESLIASQCNLAKHVNYAACRRQDQDCKHNRRTWPSDSYL